MTKKDYQALAGALYGVKLGDMDTRGREEVLLDAINAVAYVLAADNPRFDRATFVAACEDGNVNRRPKRSRTVTELIHGRGYVSAADTREN